MVFSIETVIQSAIPSDIINCNYKGKTGKQIFKLITDVSEKFVYLYLHLSRKHASISNTERISNLLID